MGLQLSDGPLPTIHKALGSNPNTEKETQM